MKKCFSIAFCLLVLLSCHHTFLFAQTAELEKRELLGVEKERILGEINAIWESQKNEVVTAEIHYKSAIFHADKGLKQLTSDEIRNILYGSELDKSPKNYVRMIEKLTTLKEGVDEPIRFGADMVLYQDVPGRRIRCNHKYHNLDQVIADGLNLVHMGDGDAATIHNISEMFIRPDAVDEFRWLRSVPLDSPTFKEKNTKVIYHIDSQCVYEETSELFSGKMCSGKTTINIADGLIVYSNFVQSDTGQAMNEEYYLYPVTLKNNITFPRLSVKVNYDVGKKRMAHIFIRYIEDIVLNHSLPKETFKISVPAETTISDFRENAQSPTSIRAHVPVPDIVAFMDGGGLLSEMPHKSQVRRRTVTIVVVNLAILCAIVFLRYRQMKNKNDS